jgi:FlaA1/EpsC-like NDP-sugar epimerase
VGASDGSFEVPVGLRPLFDRRTTCAFDLAVMAVREIRSRGEQDMDLRGFNGLKVLGSSEALPTLVPALGIDQVIITIADAPQVQLRRILSICEGIPVRAQMIPAMYDLLQGRVSITQLREVRVEDLLERETVSIEENDLVGFLGGKVVMVTGAGGAIGSELARQLNGGAPPSAVGSLGT